MKALPWIQDYTFTQRRLKLKRTTTKASGRKPKTVSKEKTVDAIRYAKKTHLLRNEYLEAQYFIHRWYRIQILYYQKRATPIEFKFARFARKQTHIQTTAMYSATHRRDILVYRTISTVFHDAISFYYLGRKLTKQKDEIRGLFMHITLKVRTKGRDAENSKLGPTIRRT